MGKLLDDYQGRGEEEGPEGEAREWGGNRRGWGARRACAERGGFERPRQ